MNAVSVCDGISAASRACAGLDYNFLLLAEIEAFPRSVLKQRHRAVDQRKYKPRHLAAGRPVLWGDFTAIRPRHIRRLHGHADVDVLFGGTPCQSFSVAGKRAGLDDPRGDLSLEYVLLAFRLGVRWFLWENVPGVLSSSKGEDFAAILSAFTGRVVEVPRDGWENAGVIPAAGPGQFGIAWRTFDAQYAGVPQRRRRIFLVGYLGDHRRAVAVLFDRESLQGHPAPRREKGQTAPTIPSRSLGGGGLGTDFDCDGGLVASTGETAHCLNAGGMGRQDYETETLITHALRADGFDASEDVTIQGAATRENASSGPDGVGIRTDGVAYTLEARSEVQAVCFDPTQVTVAHTTGAGFWKEGMGTLRGREQDSHENLIAFSCKDHGADVGEISPTLRSMGHDGSHANAGGQIAVAFNLRGREGGAMPEVDPDGLAYQRAASGGSSRSYVAHAIGLDEEQNAVEEGMGCLKARTAGGGFEGTVMTPAMAVRRLTPTECERLQGFPDNYTAVTHRKKPAADGPRYKALGNSWAVPCARWIVERIQKVEESSAE